MAYNVWTQLADAPVAQYGSTASAYNGKVYIFGGYTTAKLQKTYEYTIATNTWVEKAAATDFTVGLVYAGIAINSSDKIYVGEAEDVNSGVFAGLFSMYDCTNNTWTAKATQNAVTCTSMGVSFLIGSYIYRSTGYSQSPGAINKNTCRYDIGANSWLAKADCTDTRYGAGGFGDGTYGYVACGADDAASGYAATQTLYRYSENSWSTMANAPNPTRASLNISNCGNSAGLGWIVGGADTPNTTLYADIDEYNVAGNSWASRLDFTGTVTLYPSCTYHANKVYYGLGLRGGVKYKAWYEWDGAPNPFVKYLPPGKYPKLAMDFMGKMGLVLADLATGWDEITARESEWRE